MSGTPNVFAQVEPELKEQAEVVLARLGIPMSSAIGIFLKQLVVQGGIPLDINLPNSILPVCGALTAEQFNAELEKGFKDYSEGRIQSATEAFIAIERELDI